MCDVSGRSVDIMVCRILIWLKLFNGPDDGFRFMVRV